MDRAIAACVLVVLASLVWRASRSKRPSGPLARAVGGEGGPLSSSEPTASSFSLFEIVRGGAVVAYCADARLAGQRCVFQLDTGYAGPPVVSVSYLCLADRRGAMPDGARSRLADVSAEFERASHARRPKTADHKGAVRRLLASGSCRSYTSGCTMRLMGIGAVVEQQADLLLCGGIGLFSADGGDGASRLRTPASSAGGGGSVDADVLVTHALPHNPHILTCDYMFHLGGVVLSPSRGLVEWGEATTRRAARDASFRVRPMRLAGGAPVVEMRIGGADVRLTLDTGAPGPICLSKDALRRAGASCQDTEHVLRQKGVNGEVVCATVLTMPATVHGMHFAEVVVVVNDLPVAMTDGYVGLAFLCAFDLLLDRERLGLRRVPDRRPASCAQDLVHARRGRCPGRRPACASKPAPSSGGGDRDERDHKKLLW